MIAFRAKALESKADRPDWISDELLAETREVWEPKYGRRLTDDELLGILLGVGRLLDAIQE